jgi:hypothetical protein
MKKNLLLLLVLVSLLLSPIVALAQAPESVLGWPLVSARAITQTSYEYCVTTGENGAPLGVSIPSNPLAPVKTSGSSVTVNAVTGSTNPFTPLSVGDEIEFPVSSIAAINLNVGVLYRVVATKPSADQITVDTALDLSLIAAGYPFRWRKLVCGTAATDGWFPASQYQGLKITWEMNTLGSASADFRVECRDRGADNQPVQVWGPGATTYPVGGVTSASITTSRFAVYVPESWYQCRVGSKVTGAGTNSLTVKVSGRLAQATP